MHSLKYLLERGSMFREVVIPSVMILLLATSGYLVMHAGGKTPEISDPSTWCSEDGVEYWAFRGERYLSLAVRVDTLGQVRRCLKGDSYFPAPVVPVQKGAKR